MDETSLIQRLRVRDEAAFTELIDRHHGPLLRLAMSFVSSRGVAEEVVQETWVAVIKGLDRFEGRSSLKTWIFRILSNKAKTRGVREGRSIAMSALLEPGSDPDRMEPSVDPSRFKKNGMWGAERPSRWEHSTPESLLASSEAMQKLQTALAALPPMQAAVVMLRDVEGLDSDEVCNVLELSETNQRVLLHRGRSRLRTVLEDHMDGK